MRAALVLMRQTPWMAAPTTPNADVTAVADQELVARCRDGDPQAFRTLVDQYKRLVFGLIARQVGDQARAEELAQDVFLRVPSRPGWPCWRSA
jgi:hypothetical protein